MASSFDAEAAPDTAESRHLQQLSTFRSVTAAYVDCCQRSATTAHSIDPDSPQTPNKWSPESAHFKADIESATLRALGTDLGLQAAWWNLVLGERCPAHIAEQVVDRCGRIYAARFLEPQTYFRRTRKGSAESQKRRTSYE